jgi:hypothetical protein
MSTGIKGAQIFLFLLVLLRGDPPGKVSQDSLQKRWILNQHQVKQVDAQEPLSQKDCILSVFVFIMYRLFLLSNTAPDLHS